MLEATIDPHHLVKNNVLKYHKMYQLAQIGNCLFLM